MRGQLILVGRIGRPHGVRGLVHVTSYTADPRALASYSPLQDERGEKYRLEWAAEGIARVFVLTAGQEHAITDRAAAACLVNRPLLVAREALPAVETDEFYLADLIGLAAFDVAGTALGRVSAVHNYGAGASLEIGRLLIPFTAAAVTEVDLGAGRIIVRPPVELEAR